MRMMINNAFSLCIPPPLQLEPPGRKDLVGIFGYTAPAAPTVVAKDFVFALGIESCMW